MNPLFETNLPSIRGFNTELSRCQPYFFPQIVTPIGGSCLLTPRTTMDLMQFRNRMASPKSCIDWSTFAKFGGWKLLWHIIRHLSGIRSGRNNLRSLIGIGIINLISSCLCAPVKLIDLHFRWGSYPKVWMNSGKNHHHPKFFGHFWSPFPSHLHLKILCHI